MSSLGNTIGPSADGGVAYIAIVNTNSSKCRKAKTKINISVSVKVGILLIARSAVCFSNRKRTTTLSLEIGNIKITMLRIKARAY
jgi:hypothetical protein